MTEFLLLLCVAHSPIVNVCSCCRWLQTPTAITASASGCFSAPKQHEIVVAKGHTLELLRPDAEATQLVSVASWECFAVIRTLQTMRVAKQNRDIILVGSDSGMLIALKFNARHSRFERLVGEIFGKTGCRRTVPGQYIAADPAGRALMVSAVEQRKFVYVMEALPDATEAELMEDEQALGGDPLRVNVSSPIEAHKKDVLVQSLTALDRGLGGNPQWAALELDMREDAEALNDAAAKLRAAGDTTTDPCTQVDALASKMLTFYELDLSLNTVVRRYAEEVDATANLVVAVPGGAVGGGENGPGGVLVFSENWVTWLDMEQDEVRAPFPRRWGWPDERGLMAVNAAVHRQKGLCFVMAQTELGDLYKITLDWSPEAEPRVTSLRVEYFDTLPRATSICLLRNGFFFAACETGDHLLAAFQGLGGDTDAVFCTDQTEEYTYFAPRPLRNLLVCDTLPSLAPLTQLHVARLPNASSEDDEAKAGTLSTRLVALCGRGERAELRVLTRGVAVSTLNSFELPAAPTRVWTLRCLDDDEYHSYIVLSFANATLVLKMGDTVADTKETNLILDAPTVHVALMGTRDAPYIVQVLRDRVHVVQLNGERLQQRLQRGEDEEDEELPVVQSTDVQLPQTDQVKCASSNRTQLVLAMENGRINLFQLSTQVSGGALRLVAKNDFGWDVSSVAVMPTTGDELTAPFAAVACQHDSTVRIVSLRRQASTGTSRFGNIGGSELLDTVTTFAVSTGQEEVTAMDYPRSVLLSYMPTQAGKQLYLFAGLNNGVMRRWRLNANTAAQEANDDRSRFLGTTAVSVRACRVDGHNAVLSLSSRPWLEHAKPSHRLLPLACDAMTDAAPLNTADCADGFVGIAGKTLRIVATERLDQEFTSQRMKLKYTPRTLAVHPSIATAVVVESDARTMTLSKAKQHQAALDELRRELTGEEDADMEVDDEDEDEEEDDGSKRPYPGAARVPAEAGEWASLLRVVTMSPLRTVSLLELDENCAAVSAAILALDGAPGQKPVLVVGVAQGLRHLPKREAENYWIHVYQFSNDDRQIRLLHRTPVQHLPLAFAAFQGQLLAGVGSLLRLYALGRRRLLRKGECRQLPHAVRSIEVIGRRRIMVADAAHSVHAVTYKPAHKQLLVFADSVAPRHVTAMTALDADTVAVADKFGSLGVLRLSPEAQLDRDETAAALRYGSAEGNGAHAKFSELCNFFTADMPLSLRRAPLVDGGDDVIVYGSVLGAVGALVPLRSRAEANFFQQFEQLMRQNVRIRPLLGNMHIKWRGFYFPVKNVVDGDLLAQFAALPAEEQDAMAEELEVQGGRLMLLKKIDDALNNLM
ncbi:MAG: hypothetical protein MHM6MM_000340 [Cercozoa sp. M6MM]